MDRTSSCSVCQETFINANELLCWARNICLYQILLALVLSFIPLNILLALENPETTLNTDIGIKTELGTQIDLTLPLIDENNRTLPLSQIVRPDRPIVLVPVYFNCPRMCGLIHQGVVKLIKDLELQIGNDYSVVSVSFDSSENSELAKSRGSDLRQQLGNIKSQFAEHGWKFVVGSEQSVAALMQQLGFKYRQEGKDFAHGAAIFVLTPQGKISQYFTGIEYPVWDVRLALVEASMGGIGSAIDHFLLYCFRFDPTKGKYTWAVYDLMRVVGVFTLIGLGAVIFRATR